jgi:hypothetical protein
LQAAEAAHAAEVARVQAENARLAEGHAREVEDKLFREEQHRMVGIRGEGGGGRGSKAQLMDEETKTSRNCCQLYKATPMNSSKKQSKKIRNDVAHSM